MLSNVLIYQNILLGTLPTETLPELALDLIIGGKKHDYLFEVAALYKPCMADIDMDKLMDALGIPADFLLAQENMAA